jgi:hypothetical protein
MHQLQCGVDDTVFVDGYRVQILEVTADEVRIGISTSGSDQAVHQIRLPALAMAAVAERCAASSHHAD